MSTFIRELSRFIDAECMYHTCYDEYLRSPSAVNAFIRTSTSPSDVDAPDPNDIGYFVGSRFVTDFCQTEIYELKQNARLSRSYNVDIGLILTDLMFPSRHYIDSKYVQQKLNLNRYVNYPLASLTWLNAIPFGKYSVSPKIILFLCLSRIRPKVIHPIEIKLS